MSDEVLESGEEWCILHMSCLRAAVLPDSFVGIVCAGGCCAPVETFIVVFKKVCQAAACYEQTSVSSEAFSV